MKYRGGWIRFVAILIFVFAFAGCSALQEVVDDITGGTLSVTITSPTDGATLTDETVAVSGTIDSSKSIVAITVSTGSFVASCSSTTNGFLCSGVQVGTGSTTITVTIQNSEGATTSDSVTVSRANAISVDVTSLVDSSTTGSSLLTVAGSVLSPDTITGVTASVDGGTAVACSMPSSTSFNCPDLPMSSALTSITVTGTDDASAMDTSTVRLLGFGPAAAGSFDVLLVFFDESFNTTATDAFASAVATWESVVTGDVADWPLDTTDTSKYSSGNACVQGDPSVTLTVDDLVVFATSFSDAVGGVLGSAGPCLSRPSGSSSQWTTIAGFMQFDTFDLNDLATDGTLTDTIIHEMGHVLGIGTNWEAPGLGIDHLDYVGDETVCSFVTTFSTDPTYTGTEGVAAWQGSLGGSGSVPVEESGGAGTQCGHWNEETFDDELMTGFLNASGNPLSILSVASLEDIGYAVDTGAADPYTRPSSSLRTQNRFDIAAAEILLAPREAPPQ